MNDISRLGKLASSLKNGGFVVLSQHISFANYATSQYIDLGYCLDVQGSVPGRSNDEILYLRHCVQIGSGATHPFAEREPGAFTPGVKRPVRESDHSPPSSAEVRE